MYCLCRRSVFFFFNDTATTEIYTLSLHDALPICAGDRARLVGHPDSDRQVQRPTGGTHGRAPAPGADRKSTRLNSSHVRISYAVFCLKKKKNTPHHNKLTIENNNTQSHHTHTRNS